jgi:hypothetical protein
MPQHEQAGLVDPALHAGTLLWSMGLGAPGIVLVAIGMVGAFPELE